jgi:PhnB protein
MQIQPYLFMDGRAEEAIEFWRKAVGAEVQMLMRWKDCPDKGNSPTPMPDDKVMHASIRIGDSTILASDGNCSGQVKPQGFALSLTAKDPAEAQKAFNALSEGGQVQMPLGKTFFSPAFGMLADKFGVSWMVYVEH